MPFPVELKYIEKAEQQLSFKFPDSYKEKMLKENGGEISAKGEIFWLFPIFDTSSKKRIKRTCNSVVHETETAIKGWYGFPKNSIAIAKNDYGDYLVFINSDDLAIYQWNHETIDLMKVAENFSELI